MLAEPVVSIVLAPKLNADTVGVISERIADGRVGAAVKIDEASWDGRRH